MSADETLENSDSPTQPLPLSSHPTSIGPYQLVNVIGEGGMGIVYRAQQSHPVRRIVALKLIKLGMDTREVIARFNAERQALAMLDHPGIARVYDAGMDSAGRPYFTMEYVSGVPITTFCDDHLYTPRQRLELFESLCHAVQHAHTKGVIHRDLKPSNILVMMQDGKPVPKVIDFGIAKATNPVAFQRSIFTEIGRLIGTPEYMSPEQAEGSVLDVDTRADIYSLGVVLYELLTGTLPFTPQSLRGAGYDQMAKIIRESEPARPSTRLGQLSSAEKTPTDNKENTGANTTEIARRRHTTFRSLRELVRGDLDWITLKTLEKDRTRRYETAASLADDIRRHLEDQPVLAGPPTVRYRMQKFGRRNRPALFAAGVVLFAILLGLGLALYGFVSARHERNIAVAERVRANEQANLANQNATRMAAVRDFLQTMLLSADPSKEMGPDVKVRDTIEASAKELDAGLLKDDPIVESDIRGTIGTVYQSIGLYREAEPQFRKSLALVPADYPGRASCINNLALALDNVGNRAESEKLYREGIDFCSKLSPPNRSTLALLKANFGGSLLALRRADEARPLLESAIAIRQSLPDGEDNNNHLQQAYCTLGLLLREAGDFAGATGAFEHVKTIKSKDPTTFHTADHNLALVLGEQGKLSEAIVLLRKLLAERKKFYGRPHPFTVMTGLALADMLSNNGQAPEAAQIAGEAVEMSRAVNGESPVTAQALDKYGQIVGHYLGRLPEGEQAIRESLAMREKVLGKDDPQVGEVCWSLASILLNEKKYDEAVPIARRSFTLRQSQWPVNDWRIAVSQIQLSIALYRVKQYADAEALAKPLLTHPGPLPESAQIVPQAYYVLAKICEETNRPEESQRFKDAFTAMMKKPSSPASAPATTRSATAK